MQDTCRTASGDPSTEAPEAGWDPPAWRDLWSEVDDRSVGAADGAVINLKAAGIKLEGARA